MAKNQTKESVRKRILQIHTELGQALHLLSKLDISKLPKDVQDAIALMSSAAVHADHMVHHENISVKALTRAAEQKLPQTSVHYHRVGPYASQRCGTCAMFQRLPDGTFSCTLVQSTPLPIAPDGECDRWSARPEPDDEAGL